MSDTTSDAAEAFVHGIGELPVMGPVVGELLRLLEREDANERQVLRLLAQDPLLAAKVVRLANSSFYGGLSTPNLDQALVRIGLREVRNVVLTSSVMKIFPDLGVGIDLPAYWRHCIASGLAAHLIARRAPELRESRSQSEGLYVCGLLHHLGIFLHTLYRTKTFHECLDLSKNENLPLYVAERRLLGFDHAGSAACLLARWGFPPEVVSAVRFHHHPQEAPEEHRFCARVLHVSAMLCHAIQGPQASFEGHVGGFDEEAWFGLGFEAGDLESVQSAVALSTKTSEQLVKDLFP